LRPADRSTTAYHDRGVNPDGSRGDRCARLHGPWLPLLLVHEPRIADDEAQAGEDGAARREDERHREQRFARAACGRSTACELKSKPDRLGANPKSYCRLLDLLKKSEPWAGDEPEELVRP
jgi:hypothetical protein